MEDFSPTRLLGWAKKGGLAILDQGLFSGANFLVNILLALWLPPEQYGAFAVAYSIFLLLAAFHTAVLTEPMLVFGTGKYSNQFRKYLGILLYGHWGISLVLTLLPGIAALVFWKLGQVSLAQTLGGLAIASPFLLLFWLARRGVYVDLRPQLASTGSALHFVFGALAIYLLLRLGELSAASALVALGLVSLIASLLLLSLLRPMWHPAPGNPTPAMIFADHRGYGSWNLLAVCLYWASGQILMVLIPIFLGLQASAAVAAVWNLFRPISLTMQSLSLLLLPIFSKTVEKHDAITEWKRRVIKLAGLFAGGVLLYGMAITALAKPILHTLYAGRYDEYSILVLLFALSTSASALTQVFSLALKAKGKVRNVSMIWGVSPVVSVVLAIPLMRIAGVEGAIFSAMASYSVAAWIAWKFIKGA